MPQKRIPLKADQLYHIWTHANGSENLFREDENYHFFLKKYRYHVHPVVKTFAWCLMPNHLHLMVGVRDEEEVLSYLRRKKNDPTLQGFEDLGGFSNVISQQFSNLFNSYTQSYNKKYDRKGSLFIPNFRRKLIDSDEYVTRLILYIHNNPVHHGFVKDLNDWAYSSWHSYLLDLPISIGKTEAISWFGSRENFFVAHRELKLEQVISIFEE